MAYYCTWACYLLATLLGLAVGQNILRALTFPGSPTPPSLSSFLRLLAFQEYAIQVLGNLHAALLPSSTYSHPFSFFFHITVPMFTLSLPPHHRLFASHCPNFSLPVPVPAPLLWPLAAAALEPAALSVVCSQLGTVCVLMPSGSVGAFADSLIWTQCNGEEDLCWTACKVTHRGQY